MYGGRRLPDIPEAFYDLPTVSLKDSVEQMKAAIHVHITEQLTNQKHLSRLPGALKRTILERLLEKAEGIFRWIQCQVDEIVTCKRHIDIETALNNLPEGLYEMYDRIIQAIKQNPMDIVTMCGSLVTYDEKTGVVALSHYSVKEYLINRPNNIFKSTSDMHAQICELFITYVLCDFVNEVPVNGEILSVLHIETKAYPSEKAASAPNERAPKKRTLESEVKNQKKAAESSQA
ncbi:hypothetical protein C8R48DRAFT_771465 [Suillus tomentosus]|nr:hypothetical protein C8R48DRAFT_771465 [Suillus tomentosus]